METLKNFLWTILYVVILFVSFILAIGIGEQVNDILFKYLIGFSFGILSAFIIFFIDLIRGD